MGRSKAGFCHDGRVEQGKVGTLRTARSGMMPCLETQHREHSHGSIPASGAFVHRSLPACLLGSSRRPPGCSHCVARSFVPSRAPRRPRRSSCGVREATNEFARDVMGAVIENRDDGASRIERDGQSWFRVAVTAKTIMTSLGPLTYRRGALPQRRERGIAGAGRREPGPRRRLPDAAGGRARSADDGSLHGAGSGGVLCEDRRHDAVGEHPAAPDPEHARMLGEPRPGDAGQHP